MTRRSCFNDNNNSSNSNYNSQQKSNSGSNNEPAATVLTASVTIVFRKAKAVEIVALTATLTNCYFSSNCNQKSRDLGLTTTKPAVLVTTITKKATERAPIIASKTTKKR